ncbi:MAG: tRNA (guanosine(46)-N7)-methyltransferase TrmB [Bacteroidia bacterium]
MKDKLRRFAEFKTFPNCFDFPYELKGKWKSQVFKNEHPIVLELGCGKGEYTVELSGAFPEKNFIGIDLKSNRMWKGSKIAQELGRTNVGFIRMIVQKLPEIFQQGEADEIWITFPDPFPKDRHEKHRLTHRNFLELYRQVIKPNGVLHFKTDDDALFDYTIETFREMNVPILQLEYDVYSSNTVDKYVKEIRTHYEKLFHAKGRNIKYVSFLLPANLDLSEKAE